MTAVGITMLPYVKRGEIDYAALEYNPDEPEPVPEAPEQEPIVREIFNILASRFADFWQRPDVFISSNTILCYDPSNLNVRRQPDIYLAFGVDQSAIRRRKLYLPWEAGKPPDLASGGGLRKHRLGRHRDQDPGVRRHRNLRILALRPQRWRASR